MFSNRLDTAEERINELENRSREIIKAETRQEKEWEKIYTNRRAGNSLQLIL